MKGLCAALRCINVVCQGQEAARSWPGPLHAAWHADVLVPCSPQGIVMMGHSTGCQDTVRYVQRGYGVDPHAAPLLGAILQAPVWSARSLRHPLSIERPPCQDQP